jgi:polysaccharide export outer membrane protein
VRPDGMVSMPLLGDLPAAGMTPMALGEDIATRLKKYVHDPLVTVNVITINSKRLYILGEVIHVGPMPYTPEITPLQAISAAGGLTPYANSKKIYILRKVKGKDVKIPFNYKTALKTGNMQGVVLMTGDTIVVP